MALKKREEFDIYGKYTKKELVSEYMYLEAKHTSLKDKHKTLRKHTLNLFLSWFGLVVYLLASLIWGI